MTMCVFSIALIIKVLSKEQFADIKEIGARYVCPTRNQSFDIRGDIPIPRQAWPVFNSTIGPSHPEICTYKKLE
jgi:hypothetical protein